MVPLNLKRPLLHNEHGAKVHEVVLVIAQAVSRLELHNLFSIHL
jgi:hypothetical protein